MVYGASSISASPNTQAESRLALTEAETKLTKVRQKFSDLSADIDFATR